MRKQERRAWICLVIALVLFAGVGVFTYRFIKDGSRWAGFYGNTQIFTDGMINRGTVLDRHDELLLNCTPDGLEYADDWTTRVSTVHAVGDAKGNISSGAINMFAGELIGYDILNGTYDTSPNGKTIKLTIDAEANRTAYDALNGKTGAVGVYNWKTGEIVCMVSTPSFDPYDGAPDNDGAYYFNNFLSGRMTPGSTFKLVTAAAAIDELPNIGEFTFDCDGVNEFNGVKFRDVSKHGEVDFREALAVSCNGAFGSIARELGGRTMKEYTKKAGLSKSLKFDGIETAAGSFEFPTNDDVKLSWAGIGQADDLVNPCTMMVYMGAIANYGEPVQPTLIKDTSFIDEIRGAKSLGRYIDESTASTLKEMMKNNVVENYGEDNFPGMDIYAKSGTAETGGDDSDAWFVGFTDDEDAPYAFVVWVKNGGGGSTVAGPIARKVIQSLQSSGE